MSAQFGNSEQSTDNEPFGNNIAVDANFPAKFDSGDGSVAGFGIGYKINDRIRIEGRLSRRDGSFNDRKIGTGARAGEEYILDGEIESTTLTVEGFYDFPNQSAFTPYVKAGLGVSDNSYAARLGGAGASDFDAFDGTVDGFYDNYADDSSTELSWNVGLGGTYKLTEKASVFGEFQYANFGDVKTGADSFTDGFKIDSASAQELSVGVRINF